MKKYLPYARLVTLGAGALGMLLLFLMRLGGTDEKGLYPAAHPAWVMLCILSVAVMVALLLFARAAGNGRSFRGNFPPSILAAAGYLAACAGLLITGMDYMHNDKTIYLVCSSLGIAGGVVLFWAAWCRFRGKKCILLPHAFACFFFAMQLFALGQALGAEPELCRYLFHFLAVLSMLPACYWLWSFDVGMGERGKCLFFCLAAAYYNLVAVAFSDTWLLHLCMAAWLLTAMPQLRYQPPQPRPVADPPADLPNPQQVDAMLDQILSDLDSNS